MCKSNEPRQVTKLRSYPSFPRIPNVGIYCRVSTGLQPQLESLAAQVSAYVRLCNKKPWHLVDVFIDVKSGGRIDNRVQFQRMPNACRRGEIDLVITKSISRFGRNTEEAIIALRELKACGVTIIFDTQNMNTADNDSEVLITAFSAYAEAENESRRENQQWAQRKRLLDGTSSLYSRKCYGYEKQKDGTLTVLPEQASIVQHIFELYLSGSSILGIQKQLKKEEIPSPSGKATWSKKSIENILDNDKYTGTFIVMKRITDNIHHKRITNTGEADRFLATDMVPAIIPRDVFEQVKLERVNRSNMVTDEAGTHRKATKYSSRIPYKQNGSPS